MTASHEPNVWTFAGMGTWTTFLGRYRARVTVMPADPVWWQWAIYDMSDPSETPVEVAVGRTTT